MRLEGRKKERKKKERKSKQSLLLHLEDVVVAKKYTNPNN
jgi:hypothetical protein